MLEISQIKNQKKEPVQELLDENTRLSHQNHFLWAGLIALAAFSVFSVCTNHKNEKASNGNNLENLALKEKVSRLEKEETMLKKEKTSLENYAEDAQYFALGIRPLTDENDFSCEDADCDSCKKMEQENERIIKEFNKACTTLNINPVMLRRLQKGVKQIEL